jgi:hypothetical protein
LRRSGIIKVGAATVAAGAGLILALTSVMAHTSQPATVHVPSKSVVSSFMVTFADKQDAAEAAGLLAAEQKKAAKLAAKIKHDAAVAAEEAAESSATEAAEAAGGTAQATCKATDLAEDVSERANDQPEDAAETPGANDQAEDTAERAADAAEDATEVNCGGAEHHTVVVVKGGDNVKPGSGGAHGDH